MNNKRLAIIALICSIITEVVACIMWLLPVAGFGIYPLIGGFAVLLSVLSWIFAKGHRVIRIVSCIISVIWMMLILLDVIFIIGLIAGI